MQKYYVCVLIVSEKNQTMLIFLVLNRVDEKSAHVAPPIVQALTTYAPENKYRRGRVGGGATSPT